MYQKPDLSHRIGHRGTIKYVLTEGQNGWRVSVIGGTDEETDPRTILDILNQCVANCQALIPEN